MVNKTGLNTKAIRKILKPFSNNFNIEVIKQCRRQMRLTEKDVRDKISLDIKVIEKGLKQPTFEQIDKLSRLYQVPRWVFIAEEIPREYRRSIFTNFIDFINRYLKAIYNMYTS